MAIALGFRHRRAAAAHPGEGGRSGLHLSRFGGFTSLTSAIICVLLGFILFEYYHLTLQGLLNGFLHFLW